MKHASPLFAVFSFLCIAGCTRPTPDAGMLFFETIKTLCGRTFEGITTFPEDPDHQFAGKKLMMTVRSCRESEIRIPFVVGEDTSRTWILTLTEKGLLFKHDHRQPDGTPDELTMYGGWATTDGNATMQKFPADEETAGMIPEAITNVWTLHLDRERGVFIYDLQRHGQPRYRAEFNMGNPEKN
jgi:hypothetical protein